MIISSNISNHTTVKIIETQNTSFCWFQKCLLNNAHGLNGSICILSTHRFGFFFMSDERALLSIKMKLNPDYNRLPISGVTSNWNSSAVTFLQRSSAQLHPAFYFYSQTCLWQITAKLWSRNRKQDRPHAEKFSPLLHIVNTLIKW